MQAYFTAEWVRNFAHTFRNSSYQDKRNAMFQEKNPYYLLEWLVYPVDEAWRKELDYPRSPGMFRNSYLSFGEVFADELLFDLLLDGPVSEPERTDLMQSALYDLQTAYRANRQHVFPVEHLISTVSKGVKEFDRFQNQLSAEESGLAEEYRNVLRELDEDPELSEEELLYRRQSAGEQYRKKLAEAPRKLLQRKFAQEPMAAYLYYKGWEQPEAKIEALLKTLASQQPPIHYVETDKQPAEFAADCLVMEEKHSDRFLHWLEASFSRSELTRGWLDTESRRQWWSAVLTELWDLEEEVNDRRQHNNVKKAVFASVFHITGFEETMMAGADNRIPLYFHHIVEEALPSASRREWLRNRIILRNWPRFTERFAAESYHYPSLSWVLCLDPQSLEQRLLRTGTAGDQSMLSDRLSPAFVIERCCFIFNDAVKKGLDEELTVPLYQYLAVHNRDLLFPFLYSMKEAEAVRPLMRLDERLVNELFSGEFVRARSVRRHFAELLLLSLQNLETADPVHFWLGQRLKEEKEAVVLPFLEKTSRGTWPGHTANLLAEILHIRWLGAPGQVQDPDAWVREQLKEQSESIMFEAAPQGDAASYTWRIVRPGAASLEDGAVLARAVVRAELTDQQAITGLLDDLLNL
ncbi:hypothetical protein [Paenibacillus gansuensis]|uniref:Uncharacterized protein n=1 Tax=Paenibacillus gansuensis TaxID=306542 RepID=A0ABW5PC60_9BACL